MALRQAHNRLNRNERAHGQVMRDKEPEDTDLVLGVATDTKVVTV